MLYWHEVVHLKRIWIVLSLTLSLAASAAAQPLVLDITSSDDANLIIDAVESLPADGHLQVNLHPTLMTFHPLFVPDSGALLDIREQQVVEIIGRSKSNTTLDGGLSDWRLVRLSGDARLSIANVSLSGWLSSGNGGAILVSESAVLETLGGSFVSNWTAGSGGAIFVEGNGKLLSAQSHFVNNEAAVNGGSIAFVDNATGHLNLGRLVRGSAGGSGCEIYFAATGAEIRPDVQLFIEGSYIEPSCEGVGIDNPVGNVLNQSSSSWSEAGAIHSLAKRYGLLNSYVGRSLQPPNLQDLVVEGDESTPLCDEFEGSSFESLGYNLAEDGSCGLDQSTDLPDTDGLAAPNQFGTATPQPGSPLIDSGATEVMVFPGETLESLPCGYKDLMGAGRPQDANDDGVFECDRGAVEVAGPGALTSGTSAAFFNSLRDGEGQYVEMLNANTAVVYTFTARPDGTGSAWYIGVGYVLGNSIVIDSLVRPTGTSFGDGFDSSEIVTSLVGGQSMVFNDCEAGGMGGNVAYSGNHALGFEALITRAQRLSNILGCGSIAPHPNAGLSGSYFLPARDGEGVVVQWLPNGQVLVIFFTYDLNNDQQWVIGIGQSDGFSVTMDALYASSNTVWGSDFDPDDVVLSPWGTFELTWTECGGVQFGYNSTVSGYGSATRQYIRLSTLWETNCPGF